VITFGASFLVAVLATTGALAAGATVLSRPRVCLAILFLLASFSRATLETPLGTMRPEMPAVAVAAILLFANGRFSSLRGLPRSAVAMSLAFGTFLAVLTLSSVLMAPGRSQSLHMVAWYALSMLSGVVAFVLIRPRPADSIEPFALGGAAMGALGVLAAALFLVAGPGFNLGIQEVNSLQPRVYAVGWETNLYASFLAMCAFFALEAARRDKRAGSVMLACVLIGFPLGITRGAYVGLAAGALVYVVTLLAIRQRPVDLARMGVLAGSLVAVGVLASMVMLPNLLERPSENPQIAVASSSVPGTSPGQPQSTPKPTPTPTPTPTLAPAQDTVAFRLDRVPVALKDLPHSPIIGFGAESFGQNHPERYAGSGPDHLAIMVVSVLYETGVVGAAALTIGFLLLLLALWRSARRSALRLDQRTAGAAAAFLAALIALLVSYQVTTSLQFSLNWIVIGAAAALTVRESSAEPTAPRG
jgi:hypothetical protein